jgi:hypothetical protein
MNERPAWEREAKHVFSKADSRLTEDVETATEYLMGRGHAREQARRLAEFLNDDDHAHSVAEARERDRHESVQVSQIDDAQDNDEEASPWDSSFTV